MHITIIRHSIRNRGGDRLVLDYLSFLMEKGHEVIYWTNEVSTTFPIHPKINIRRIPYPGILGTMFFTFIKKFNTDLVLVDLVIMASLTACRNRAKLICLAQGYDVGYYKSRLLRGLTHFCYRLAFKKLRIPVIAVSEQLATQLKRYELSKIWIIPNGVDLNLYYPDKNSTYIQCKKKPFTIVLFVRNDFAKGLDIGKKALEELWRLRQTQDWEVWTIGDESIEFNGILVRNLGFISSDEELKNVLSAADIYLIPSRSEGLSLLLLQALACQCAIVTTAASSIIEHEMNGLVSPIEDWKGLAQNLNRVMENAALRERLQKKGRELAEQYDLKKSCQKFEEALLNFSKDK